MRRDGIRETSRKARVAKGRQEGAVLEAKTELEANEMQMHTLSKAHVHGGCLLAVLITLTINSAAREHIRDKQAPKDSCEKEQCYTQ